MKFIIGKKIEMTQIWEAEKVVAVTKIAVDPCTVVQIKNAEKDGYKAVQLGYGERKEKNIKKPQKNHMKDYGNFRGLKEFRIDNEEVTVKPGDTIDINTFEPGDSIQVTGTTKGRGFQGVVKRWGFSGSKKTHGNKDQLRMPGSIGATGPAHVFKGTKMGGRMGGAKKTIKNLEIAQVDEKNNIIYIKGPVPGARNGLILILGNGDLKIKAEEKKAKVEEKEAKPAAEENKTEEVKAEETTEKVDDKKEKATEEKTK